MNGSFEASNPNSNKHSMLQTAGLVIFLTAGLAACASSGTDYLAASDPGDYGYSERKLTENRYRVSFTGNSRTPVELVQDYALLRAAQLTIERNHEWFSVADRSTTPQVAPDDVGAEVEIVTGGSTHTRCGLLGCSTTRYSPAFEVEVLDFPNRRQHYTASIEVVMGSGEISNPVQIYDAMEIIDSVSADI